MKQQTLLVMNATIIVLLFACSASAWNTSTHMVTGAIAYQKQPDAWAKESYEIAVKIAYENGNLRGTPKGQARDCREVPVNEQ